jgi:hypothetical protein
MDLLDSMQDTGNAQNASDSPIRLRFVLASIVVQFLAPAVGMLLFDLAYSPSSGVTPIEYFTWVLRFVSHSWKLAVEPLAVAVVLVISFSAMTNRRNRFTMIVVITLLNALASCMLIVSRSL